MKTFRITKEIEIVCEAKRTRNGFKHEATLLINGLEDSFAKLCYLNRTWERYEYQSVLEEVIEKSKGLTPKEKELAKKSIENEDFLGGEKETDKFKTLANIMAVGEFLAGNDLKTKNDWKTRMLKAGLGEGVIMPEDWDELSEEEKEKRLDKIINEFRG
jgi:hypothetical protein